MADKKKQDNSMLGVLSTIGKGLLMVFCFFFVLSAFGAGISAMNTSKSGMYDRAAGGLLGGITAHQVAKELDGGGDGK